MDKKEMKIPSSLRVAISAIILTDAIIVANPQSVKTEQYVQANSTLVSVGWDEKG